MCQLSNVLCPPANSQTPYELLDYPTARGRSILRLSNYGPVIAGLKEDFRWLTPPLSTVGWFAKTHKFSFSARQS